MVLFCCPKEGDSIGLNQVRKPLNRLHLRSFFVSKINYGSSKKEDKIMKWVEKFTSRKLWVAVAAFVSGLIVAFKGDAETAETVSGIILQGAAVLGYLLAEGLVDAKNAGAPLIVEGDVMGDVLSDETE